MFRQLVVQRAAETAGLITSHEQGIITVMETHGLNIVNHLTIMTVNFLRIL